MSAPPAPTPDTLTLAGWNVNSIKVRGEAVAAWLTATASDILFMQETKSTDDNFPAALFADAGYRVEYHGQKTYNGVAVAVREASGLAIDAVRCGLPTLPDSPADEQARYIEIDCAGMILGGIYLPNGNPVEDGESDKFRYKLDWMQRLVAHARALNGTGKPVIFCGDFNIIPAADDCHDIAAWEGDALHHPQSLALWRELCWQGFTDTYRALHPPGHPDSVAFSFWDYQRGAWQKDHGIRIDHILANPEATDLLLEAGIDREPRGAERASDHTPVWVKMAKLK